MAIATYTVTARGGSISFSDAYGNIANVTSSASVSLTDSQYQTLVALLGATNVVPASPTAQPTALTAGLINTNVVVADSGTHASSFTGATQTNNSYSGVMIIMTVSAYSGSPAPNAQVQVGDGLGNFVNLAGVQVTVTGVGTYVFGCYPGAVSEGGMVNMPLPQTWNINYTFGGAGSFTLASVVACYIK